MTISGDLRPRRPQRLYFKLWHHFRHLRERGYDHGMPEVTWPKVPNDLARQVGFASPSRILSDLFWSALDWSAISQMYGTPAIHDLGCGTGRYAARLDRWSGGFASYAGWDITPRSQWRDGTDSRISLRAFDGADFAATMTGEHNMFVSQSAMEHVWGDLDYFKAAADYAADRKRPILHVHLLPGVSALPLYRTHGYRQYTAKNLAAIRREFPADAVATVFLLGNPRFNRLHFEMVRLDKRHWPSDDSARYCKKIERLLNMAEPCRLDEASFLALAVELNSPRALGRNLSQA